MAIYDMIKEKEGKKNMELIIGEKYHYYDEEECYEVLTAIEHEGGVAFLNDDEEIVLLSNIEADRLKKAPLELEWGETPWDHMTREELLREVQRMYSALSSSQSIHDQSKFFAENYGGNKAFWEFDGVGGSAYEKARQILEPIKEKYSSESMYRSFFRYADDLLFENNGYKMLGSGWVVCNKCGNMIARDVKSVPDLIGKKCADETFTKDCDGVLEALNWVHLSPTKKEA